MKFAPNTNPHSLKVNARQQLASGLLLSMVYGLVLILVPVSSNQVAAGSLFEGGLPGSIAATAFTHKAKETEPALAGFHILQEGSSKRNLKQAAVAELKKLTLPAHYQQLADSVLNQVSLYRRLPELQLSADRTLYQFFLNHPDAVISLWKVLGVTQLNIAQIGVDTYQWSSIDGSCGTLQILHKTAQSCLVYCDGAYENGVTIRPIESTSLFYLKTNFNKQPDGTYQTTHSAEILVSIPSRPIEATAKLISPLSNPIADHNFREISLFLHTMTSVTRQQPEWVFEWHRRMEGLEEREEDELYQILLEIGYPQRQEPAGVVQIKDEQPRLSAPSSSVAR